MTPIQIDNSPNICVHGTYYKSWDSIKQKVKKINLKKFKFKFIYKKGLSRMNRQHIHFSKNIDPQIVISGIRNSCQIAIYIDIKKAIKGLK
jgi:RNA:NAD 2'-phosphotransferase (TPT1/KptA family)